MFGPPRPAAYLGRASGSFGAPNSLAGFLLLLLPALGALTFRRAAAATARIWWGWVGLVLSLGLVLTLSRGAWLALGLVFTAWPLWAVRGGWRRRAGWTLAMLVGVLSVGITTVVKFPKARERYLQLVADSGERTRPLMWRGAWELFRGAPLGGTGAGSYNVLFERHRPEGFRDEPMWAHNEYLNTLSDYGVIGFLLLFGAMGVIAVRCCGWPRSEPGRRRWVADPFVVAGMGAGLMAFSLQMFVDFHLKVPALALASAVVAALAVGAAWPVVATRAASGVVPRGLWVAVAGTTVAAVVLVFGPMIEAEALRSDARRAVSGLAKLEVRHPDFGKVLPAARQAMARATGRDPANAQAWADLAYTTALLAHVEPARRAELGREAEAAANRALDLSQVNHEFWIRRGVARDLQGRWIEAGADFVRALGLAPANSYAWYHHAFHLNRRPSERTMAAATLAFCLRLDPWNPAALALREQLANPTKIP
jgi:hypothetical protein